MNIYLVEITAIVDATGTSTTLRYSSGNGFATQPGETPSNTFYEPRIKQPALVRRDMFNTGTTGGSSRTGFGELILSNVDGGLDSLIDYGFDGQQIVIRYGDSAAAYPSGFTTVLVGTMEQPVFEFKQVAVKIRDRQEELSTKPFQTTKFAGTNSLPNGLEGVATDIKGKPKPRTYGVVYNVSPPIVNTSRLIYQVNDGAISTVDAVYDRGVSLTKGADYTSQSDMETNVPAASNYRVWPAGGYFRLGTIPVGQITADVTQGSAASDRTVGQIVNSIVQNVGGIASGDVSSSDITALDTANSSVVGVYVDSETTINSVLDELSNSVGAWWGFDNTGKFRIKQLVIPSGTSVATFTDTEIISIERSGTSDYGKGIPAYRIKLQYEKYYTTQDSDLAGSVTDARRAIIKEQYRNVTSTDSAIQTQHKLAPEVPITTLLTSASDAQTESDRLLTIYKVRRDRLDVKVRIDSTVLSVIDMGVVVTVTLPRFGYTAGKQFRVIGIQPDLRLNTLELTLWG